MGLGSQVEQDFNRRMAVAFEYDKDRRQLISFVSQRRYPRRFGQIQLNQEFQPKHRFVALLDGHANSGHELAAGPRPATRPVVGGDGGSTSDQL